MEVDRKQSAGEYLAQQLSRSDLPASLRPFYERFAQLYERKLWFQLTNAVFDFVRRGDESAPYQIELWHSFISDFGARINQLKRVQIGIAVARQYTSGEDALAFLRELADKVDGDAETREAFVLATVELAHFQLLLGDADGAKAAVERCAALLDQFDSVDKDVHAAFYRVSGDLHKYKAEYVDYYRNSLLYLACIDPARDLSADERTQRAHDLGLSALLGSIYNFGELLLHPILDALDGTPHAFIKDLLFAFNAGDIGRFEALVPQLSNEPILAESFTFLREKICLMALLESVFRRSTAERAGIPFDVVARETRLATGEVEHVVMKALSLGLVRGELDQVTETTTLPWVQPRFLDPQQVRELRDRLGEWEGTVGQVEKFTSAQMPELLA